MMFFNRLAVEIPELNTNEEFLEIESQEVLDRCEYVMEVLMKMRSDRIAEIEEDLRDVASKKWWRRLFGLRLSAEEEDRISEEACLLVESDFDKKYHTEMMSVIVYLAQAQSCPPGHKLHVNRERWKSLFGSFSK